MAQDVLDLDFDGLPASDPAYDPFSNSSLVEQDILYLDASSSPNRLFFGDDVDNDKSTVPTQINDIFLVRGSSTPTDLAGSVPVFDDFSATILSTTNWPTATRNQDADCTSLDTTGGVAALDVTWSGDGSCRYRIVNPTQARTIAADILVSSYSETS